MAFRAFGLPGQVLQGREEVTLPARRLGGLASACPCGVPFGRATQIGITTLFGMAPAGETALCSEKMATGHEQQDWEAAAATPFPAPWHGHRDRHRGLRHGAYRHRPAAQSSTLAQLERPHTSEGIGQRHEGCARSLARWVPWYPLGDCAPRGSDPLLREQE